MALYTAIALASGSLEVQLLAGLIFDKVSRISEKPLTGDRYWNPNTKRASVLYGATEFEPITAEMLLSEVQYNQFLVWKESPKALDGSLIATHVIGKIKTTLLGVRYGGYEFGEIDTLSNNASKLTINLSFEGVRKN